MKRFVVSVSILVFALGVVVTAQRGSFTVEDLLKVRRVDNPRVSPDGKRVAFTIGDVAFEANKVVNQIYVVDLDGSGLKQLTSSPASATAPLPSRNGRRPAMRFAFSQGPRAGRNGYHTYDRRNPSIMQVNAV